MGRVLIWLFDSTHVLASARQSQACTIVQMEAESRQSRGYIEGLNIRN